MGVWKKYKSNLKKDWLIGIGFALLSVYFLKFFKLSFGYKFILVILISVIVAFCYSFYQHYKKLSSRKPS